MPYPAQTNREQIIATAWELIERDGAADLSLATVAAALGIRAPSLYRHVASKEALLAGVNALTWQQLAEAYRAALDDGVQPAEQLGRVCQAHRRFAHAHPHTYILALTTAERESQAEPSALEQFVAPIDAIMVELVGHERALPLLRGAFALVHGFAMLELRAQLRRPGNLDVAFDAVVAAYLDGCAASVAPAS